jgi:hypothetical protein
MQLTRMPIAFWTALDTWTALRLYILHCCSHSGLRVHLTPYVFSIFYNPHPSIIIIHHARPGLAAMRVAHACGSLRLLFYRIPSSEKKRSRPSRPSRPERNGNRHF